MNKDTHIIWKFKKSNLLICHSKSQGIKVQTIITKKSLHFYFWVQLLPNSSICVIYKQKISLLNDKKYHSEIVVIKCRNNVSCFNRILTFYICVFTDKEKLLSFIFNYICIYFIKHIANYNYLFWKVVISNYFFKRDNRF